MWCAYGPRWESAWETLRTGFVIAVICFQNPLTPPLVPSTGRCRCRRHPMGGRQARAALGRTRRRRSPVVLDETGRTVHSQVPPSAPKMLPIVIRDSRLGSRPDVGSALVVLLKETKLTHSGISADPARLPPVYPLAGSGQSSGSFDYWMWPFSPRVHLQAGSEVQGWEAPPATHHFAAPVPQAATG